MTGRRQWILGLMASTALAITGCGKRGRPTAPPAEPGDAVYPGFYPHSAQTLKPRRDEETATETPSAGTPANGSFSNSQLIEDPYVSTTTYGAQE